MAKTFAAAAPKKWHDQTLPRHLTRAITLDEALVPPLLAFGVVLIGGLLALFLTWASITPINETTNAAGQVIPSGYVQSVQHRDGGIVREILVQDGQMVEAGQALVRLDDTDANADLGQMRARRDALQSQAGRLRNFVASVSASKARQTPLTAGENAILRSMQASRASQQSVLRDQIAQKQKELVALAAMRGTLEKNVALTAQQNRMVQDTARDGYGSKMMAMTSERDLNEVQGQLQETVTQATKAQDAINEAQNRLRALDADLTEEAMKNIGTVDAELAEVTTSLAKVEAAASRTTLVAPVRGIVKGLAVHTLGAVIEPGKTVLELVPTGQKLDVEALVPPTEIGHLKIGQPVNVKISAYDFSRYGDVKGKVQNISASTFQMEKDQSFYKVRITLDQAYVGADASQNPILPGMTANADIVTGHKTLLQYLLKPMTLASDAAFHER